jgi:hypothetical protein
MIHRRSALFAVLLLGALLAFSCSDDETGPDTTPPSVALAFPEEGDTLSADTTLVAEASDNEGVAEVAFLVGDEVIGTDSEPPYEQIWLVSEADLGPHTLWARASDTSGNASLSDSVSVTVIEGGEEDLIPPQVGLTHPADGDTLREPTTISAHASDEVGVSYVDFFIDGLNAGTDSFPPYEQLWDVTAEGQEGDHELWAAATDLAGNTGISDTIAVHVADTYPPTVAILYPEDGGQVTPADTVRVAATDPGGVAWVALLVDGEPAAIDSLMPFQFVWNLLPWADDDTHMLTAQAGDPADNVGTSSPVTVSIQRPLAVPLTAALEIAGPGTHNDHEFERLAELDPLIVYEVPTPLRIRQDTCIRGNGATVDLVHSGQIVVVRPPEGVIRFDIDHCIIQNGRMGAAAPLVTFGGALEYSKDTEGWVVNNTFYSNDSWSALYLYQTSPLHDFRIFNNIFFHNSSGLIRYDGQSFLDITHNDAVGNGLINFGEHCACPHSPPLPIYPDGILLSYTNFSDDPRFVRIPTKPGQTADLHLQATSPCRGVGENGEDLGALPYVP